MGDKINSSLVLEHDFVTLQNGFPLVLWAAADMPQFESSNHNSTLIILECSLLGTPAVGH